MKKIAVVFCVVFSLAAGAAAQRTVTNAELAKHREKRLAAEREYRDNYERMGFPSPEQLEADRERDMADRLQLADQLRQARLEKERLELDQRRLALEAERMEMEREANSVELAYPPYSGFGAYGGYGLYDYGYSGRARGRRGGFGSRLGLPSYRATPVGIVYEPGGRPSSIWSPVRPAPTGPAWRAPRPRR